MKIKTKELNFDKVMTIELPHHKNPIRPNIFFRSIMLLAGMQDLIQTNFSYTNNAVDALKKPCLILMNHSSFIDLEIASKILFPKPFCIVCTNDGFVGKEWLMRHLGCIPTYKFVSDISLISDIKYTIEKLKTSVLMYPEASYTFDGCATPLPRHLGLLIKKLNVSVVFIKTYGAFARDPLYNCLQKRKMKVSANVSVLLDKNDLEKNTADEIDLLLDKAFTFNNFQWQYDNKIIINEPFRADGLNRILYKCPNCHSEGTLIGKGTFIICQSCKKKYELTELGKIEAKTGDTEFDTVPSWYAWERDEVKKEISNGTYYLDIPVKIGILRDYKNIYMVGTGRLIHNIDGFSLTGCNGSLSYQQGPLASYGLYADYYWYEIGDVICIGNKKQLYYCFPQDTKDVVAKTRMATEELYKLKQNKRLRK